MLTVLRSGFVVLPNTCHRHCNCHRYFLMSPRFYITTTIPYVNADPHIGFALEIVQADIIARYKKLAGFDVFFNTGTDEHGVKVYRKALERGVSPQVYTDEYAEKFKKILAPLGISENVNFIRTTDPHHVHAAQEFWKRCANAGDIYKKNYKIKYCVGCELEKTEQEIENGHCPVHPNLKLEVLEEENYFFRLSKYTERLLKLFDSGTFVLPDFRLNEIRSLIKEKGLEDFSASRLKEKMPWGVAVPGDEKHVMYVWFDAFVNYISAIGWPDDMKKFEKWWPVVQFAGKDQVRQQAVMWQAMLMSARLPPSKQIVIHGFITSGGEKMSKSLGNVIDPLFLAREYGTDALRFYLARHVHPFEDSDFTMDKLKEAYNANLANGLGNFVARVMKLSEQYINDVQPHIAFFDFQELRREVSSEKLTRYFRALDSFHINSAIEIIWEEISFGDELMQKEKMYERLKKEGDASSEFAKNFLQRLWRIAVMLEPFMPDTSDSIKRTIKINKKPESLFLRK